LDLPIPDLPCKRNGTNARAFKHGTSGGQVGWWPSTHDARIQVRRCVEKRKGYLIEAITIFWFVETLLPFTYFEICHYNSLFLTKTPQNTYGDSLNPLAGIYDYVYFVVTAIPYH
jgi:hypothetical protein